MMTPAHYFDAPAHPLGLVTHPDWDAVRDRWNTLWCAAVLNQAREERAPALYATYSGEGG